MNAYAAEWQLIEEGEPLGEWFDLATRALHEGKGEIVCYKKDGSSWQFDATEELEKFGLECARSAAHLYYLDQKAKEYLEKGSSELREEFWEGEWNHNKAHHFAYAASGDAAFALAGEAAGTSFGGAGNPVWEAAWKEVRAQQEKMLTKILSEGAAKRGLTTGERLP